MILSSWLFRTLTQSPTTLNGTLGHQTRLRRSPGSTPAWLTTAGTAATLLAWLALLALDGELAKACRSLSEKSSIIETHQTA
jgi:hypothetical protein